ncbi:leucine zipper putative tumor suppressor 2 homolog [Octopus sinensis]|uniref:Leucine zipper putative tumor suppressor 2 homolog n=1 Tax=Octopus sinensis TaxID=2607531 RepID=A0A6P7U385_9MOLL|nr:leucine zipper putative tumor suppressor 2 homolog [Octopus sinensis]XP_036356420.1 leucine zipper putative tumor suppressor 2 homolog [Octopus sinensis]XP_036356421.1 leucine zipper putative tumor suppressor 2 homolog [Octopus sinensis]XP_036356422.1 leucine zipper putative tumor suppressor 2 homolog [Octopus sinensis]
MATCNNLQCVDKQSIEGDPTSDSASDIYKPPSNYSTYSQEVKYIFDPTCSLPHQDYSYIRAGNKNGRLSSSINGQLMTTSSYCARSSGCHSRSSNYQMVSSHYHSLEECYKQETRSPFSALKVSNVRNSSENLNYSHPIRVDCRDSKDSGPPKLAPVSGILTRAPGKGLVRPIAFKPVVSNRYVKRSNSQSYHDQKHPTMDDGYGSQECNLLNQSSANVLPSSHPTNNSDPSSSFPSELRASDHADPLRTSSVSHLSSSRLGNCIDTPSPSDSGVGELEAMLKEKEHEIMALREVMDKNERAIFQVYEEQKNLWHNELKDLKEEYEKRNQVQQKKSAKYEQSVGVQVQILQQEKNKLQELYNELLKERESLLHKTEELKKQLEFTKCQLEISRSELQKTTEFSQKLLKASHRTNTLKAQKRNSMDNSDKATDEASGEEAHSHRMSLLACSHANYSIEHCDVACQTENLSDNMAFGCADPSLCSVRSKLIGELQWELQQYKEQVGMHKKDFEHERDQWLEEKSKVIRYQKQLQLNYIQMFRKNKNLEAEVEQLTLDLENRDLKLLALNGAEESVC